MVLSQMQISEILPFFLREEALQSNSLKENEMKDL